MMSSQDDSTLHSSSSDDFATILEVELCNTYDENDLDTKRVKRQKVELCPGIINPQNSPSCGESSQILGPLPSKVPCAHPAFCKGLCIICGLPEDDDSVIPLNYMHKILNFRIANHEMARVRGKDIKNMVHNRRKLYLVLDLDHTLLNSAQFTDIKEDETYLNSQRDALPDTLQESLFKLENMHMMTKLRPFVRSFLKEASSFFEMYIYTMGERPYALEMAKLLDPRDEYFCSRIIARGDSTKKNQKGLDILLEDESTVIILDDTEEVWKENKENLILMERYHYFSSSCKSFGINQKSLSQLRIDENEAEGALATALKILRRVHTLYFEMDREEDQDVREVLKAVRKEVLKNCKIVFTGVIPSNTPAEHHHFWRMAEHLGATCSVEVDSSVTHVVSQNARTQKSRWAQMHNKFVVSPVWLEACNYMWRKQPEDKFRPCSNR